MLALLGLAGLGSVTEVRTVEDVAAPESVEGRKMQAATCVMTYQQCGGGSWNGETTCCDPAFECAGSSYYKQCKPKMPSPPPPTPPPPPPSPAPPPLPGSPPSPALHISIWRA